MTDDVDRAQTNETLDRQRAVQIELAASGQYLDAAAHGLCIACEDPIEPERLRVLGEHTARCASCAQDYDARQRRA